MIDLAWESRTPSPSRPGPGKVGLKVGPAGFKLLSDRDSAGPGPARFNHYVYRIILGITRYEILILVYLELYQYGRVILTPVILSYT